MSYTNPEIGDNLTVRVTRIHPEHGVFVMTPNGFGGLIRPQNIAWKNQARIIAALSEGDMFEAQVKYIQPDGKIEFNRKALLQNPADLEIGTPLKGVIDEILENKLLVRFDGFVAVAPKKELSSSFYCLGDEINTFVIDKSEDERGRINIKLSTLPYLEYFAKQHSEGDKIIVNYVRKGKLKDKQFAVVSIQDLFLIDIPEFKFIEPYKNSLVCDLLTLGEELEFVFTGVNENRGTILLDMRPILQERNREKILKLKTQISEGDVVFAEVKKVGVREAHIQIEGTDFMIPISRDELSPNKVIRATDEVFVGERIKVAYLGEDEEGNLIFSRRGFVKDKYDDNLYEMSLEDLLATMDIHSTTFIGKVNSINGDYFFSELMTVTAEYSSEDGKLLIDPVNGKNIMVIMGGRMRNLVEEGEYYEVTIELADKERRKEEGTPYLFHISRPPKRKCQNPYKETVNLSFKQHTSPNTNAGMARLLGEVGQNLYTSKKRMFFELLQNADDAAPSNGVKVKLQLEGEYFVLTHDGYSFNKHDFTSITSAARSTKSSNKKKTGYKGIGFKSVFTNSNSVFIKSGGFDFAFNRDLDIYNNFEEFYFLANEIEHDTSRQAYFLKKYASSKASFNGVKDIPWQLLPVWSKGPSIDAKNSIFYQRENVAIALHMDSGTLSEYDQAIDEVFEEPRFMLFLRNTNRIQLIRGKQCLTIQKNISDNGKYIALVNSFKDDKKSENFKVFSLDNLVVNDEAFAEAGVLIRRKERINKRGDKENYFVRIDSAGAELSEVPEMPDRITSATETSISLAVLLDEEGRVKTIEKDELSLYAFLPMNEHRFKFPFFINADFIPKSDREGVQSDNPWNYFLFYNIGKAIVSMVLENASVFEKEYLNLLPIKELETSSQDTSLLADSFNRGYKQALASAKFILNDQSSLAGTEEIIVDDSKLAEYIGHEGYYSIVGTSKHLPHPQIESKTLSSPIFGIERTTVANVVDFIKNNHLRVHTWIAGASKENREKFFEWLTKDKASAALITSIPSLKYGEFWVSYMTAANTDNFIITTSKLLPIVEILKRLGFRCSDTILDNHPLKDYLNKQDEKKLFAAIVSSDVSNLSFSDRLALFNCAKTFEGIGDETLGKWSLFKNAIGQLTPLSRMFAYSDSCPEWLKAFMIHKEENHKDLSSGLVAEDNIYGRVIEPFIDDILCNIDVATIYGAYSQSWRQAFTVSLINKDVSGILSVVEQSDLGTKDAYIKKLSSLELSSQSNYEADSFEYRVIKVAIGAGASAITHLRSITTIDGVKLLDVTLKDEFVVEYFGKKYSFSLSKILPSYSSSSNLSIVASKFSSITEYESVFAQSEAIPATVWKQLILYLSQYHGNLPLESEQYCFMMMYRRAQGYNSFDSVSRPLINLRNEKYFHAVLDRCLAGDLGEVLGYFLNDPYVTYPCGKVSGKYIDSDDYTLEAERAPMILTSWADTKEKKSFLLKLGIHNNESQEITRRASFKKNVYENIWSISDRGIITTFLEWVKNSFDLPIIANNQVIVLDELFSVINGQYYYYEEDLQEATEWGNEQYLKWKTDRDFRIYQIPGELPCRGFYNNVDLFRTRKDEFIYFSNLKRLYISTNRNPEVLLADVYSKQSIPFTKDDWNSIFTVSTTALREKEEEIARLKIELEEARKMKAGNNDGEVDEHGKYIEKDNTDERTRRDINRDARLAAKDFLDCLEDYDASSWNPENSTHIVRGIIKYKDKPITVAILSSRKRKLYLHPRLFAELMQDSDNLLLNYGYDDRIHSLSFDSIFKDNPNVNLIFDTDYVSAKEIAELANKYMNSKKTCFVVENINYSQDERIKSFGLNETKRDGSAWTNLSDEDIFDFGED